MAASRDIKRKMDEVKRRAKRAARQAATAARSRPAGGNPINVAGRINVETAINAGSDATTQIASSRQTTHVRQPSGTEEGSETTFSRRSPASE
jgi:hypothetical protein